MKRRILHIITGLERGGAENVLFQLLLHQDQERFQSTVVSLTTRGDLGDEIEQIGVAVYALNLRPISFWPSSLLRLVRVLWKIKPDVVQTWMYHANLIGGIFGKLFSKAAIIWCLHHTDLDPENDKQLTIRVSRLSAALSRLIPDMIVSVSYETERLHSALGYAADKMTVIPNGFDTSYFNPEANRAGSLRYSLGIKSDTPVIGMAARFHPQKNYENLFQAADLLLQTRPEVHFLLCGSGVTPGNIDLQSMMVGLERSDHLHLLGKQQDMAAFYGALTIATLSSAYGEAFPMTIGEAMASGKPCVVTDVGDASWIVGETGTVVSPKNPAQLCQAWLELLQLSPTELAGLGAKARQRIIELFSVERMVEEYTRLWIRLTGSKE